MTAETIPSTEEARRVTDDEVEFFRENGWVSLERLISSELAAEMLAVVKGVMGENPVGDDAVEKSEERIKVTSLGGRVVSAPPWQDYHYMAREGVEPLHSFSFSKRMGENAHRLMARDVPVRYYSDMIACKMPAGQPGGGITRWHQDLSNIPLDRKGGISIWMALDDCPPERGTMRFLSGSFRAGPLGRPHNDNMLDDYPEVRDAYELSPALHLRAGDATAHDSLTLHSAPQNTTAGPRWGFVTFFVPGDIRYTGAPHGNFIDTGIEPYGVLDHPRFPIIFP